MNNTGILFDFNGVLVDDEDIHQLAFAASLKVYGIELTDALYFDHCLGKTDKEGFLGLKKSCKSKLGRVVLGDLIEQKQAYYRKFVGSKDIFYPGVVELVQSLVKEFKLAIVTSSSRDEVRAALNVVGLIDKFQLIVTAEDVSIGKPNPEGYLKASKRIQLHNEDVVVVEDSPSGVSAAKAAGLKCIAVLHTSSAHSLRQADVIINSVSDINCVLINNVIGRASSIHK